MEHWLPRVAVTILACLPWACSTAYEGPRTESTDASWNPPKCRVIARVNGLPICMRDYEQEMSVGRLGGVPRLVMDELASLTLVFYECRRLGRADLCSGPEPAHVRAERFLRAMFPGYQVCGRIRRENYMQAYERLALAGKVRPDPDDPVVRMDVENFICEARARRARRRYVRALRKHAVIEYLSKPWEEKGTAKSRP